MLNYILPNGELTLEGKSVWKKLSDDKKREMYQWMRFLRYVDRRCISLQRQGKLGTYVPLAGQEAAQVGSALALRNQDWLFPTYRDHGAILIAGVPLHQVLLYWMGRVEGNQYPEGVRVLPPAVPIATHLPHAVGAAWAAKLRKEDSIAIAYFGDGATSEGDFHEACNFAGVFQIPVIFFCQNNGYAISVPFSRQSATKTVVEKAKGYAMEGIRVDGNDVLAVYDVIEQSVNRLSKRNKPILIEAVTYRLGGHTTADDPKRYRSELEERSWHKKDPLLRYRKLLINEDLWSDREEQEWFDHCEKKLKQALIKIDQIEKPSKQHLFAYLFADRKSGGVFYGAIDDGRSNL